MSAAEGARKLRDLAKAGHLAQPEAYVVPTGTVLVHQIDSTSYGPVRSRRAVSVCKKIATLLLASDLLRHGSLDAHTTKNDEGRSFPLTQTSRRF